MSESPAPRRSQRRPLSCLNCARQKIRCSKTIPCLSCIDRGQASSCEREVVQITRSGKRRRTRQNETERNETDDAESTPQLASASPLEDSEHIQHLGSTVLEPPASSKSLLHSQAPHIRSDAVVTLEFLSHGRQSIFRIGDTNLRPQPGESIAWDLFFTTEQAHLLLDYHRNHISWMHNVVHMPTFCSEFEEHLSNTPQEKSWVALYYALICSTVYHADEPRLLDMGISSSISLVQTLYDRSIQYMYEANFMAAHRLANVQTICVLLQVAYNIDQADLISVLISAAIRISQSLGLHRLGPDRDNVLLSEGTTTTEYLIDREVKKRTWWFLVRQDWLQIPFQNTFVIHANQFNTPLPLNCHEDVSKMVRDGKVVVLPSTTFTPTSYSNELHKVAIVIWKHQNRVCASGHPGNSREGVLRLYEHTMWADAELKSRYKEMPGFFRNRDSGEARLPDFVKQLPSIQLLSFAHKTHTVHRYFQLQSFGDRAFAFTQQSCLAISQLCIKDLESWPRDTASSIAMKMWTVITHIITCCVNLTFSSIFRKENTLLYDAIEMQRLARVGRETVRSVECWSSIARRGGALLDALFEIDDSLCYSDQAYFSMEEIIRKVMKVDEKFHGSFSFAPELVESYFEFDGDWI